MESNTTTSPRATLTRDTIQRPDTTATKQPAPIGTAFLNQQALAATEPAPRYDFYDTGDSQTKRINGTRAALRNGGVDLGDGFVTPCAEADAVAVVGADGHAWKVWGENGFAILAERPRTDAERAQWIDGANARRIYEWFSADRVLMCRDIAIHLYAETGFNPDKPLTRAERRNLKHQLRAMSEALSNICQRQGPGMAENRALLASAGIHSPQRNFSA